MAWTGDMLQGIRVVELGIWVAAPAAGGLLADWGADVIKVEAPAGDPMRKMFGSIGVDREEVPPFGLDNRGKRCITLDLASEDGRRELHVLLETADVFLTNLRMDALGRLGLDDETVRARHPKLIYAIVTGYGMVGPEANRAGYDVGAFWARSSLAHSMVPPGELPPAVRSGTGDHATGTTIAAGILAALLNRERTGEGRLVHTSLLRTGIYLNGWDISIRQQFGRIASTRPRTRYSTPLVNCYAAADGRGFWLIGLEQDRHWPILLRAIGREDLGQDPLFLRVGDRAKNCEPLIAILDEIFRSKPYAYWVDRFDVEDVWWAPINSIADVLEDPQAIAAGAFIEQPSTDGKMVPSVATPVDFSDFTIRPGVVRGLGADNVEVLAQLHRT
jgi:crotonobetainyl-CoA:carnitine CoA-transferase CaiB-like acyl-CoA transferase